MGEIIIAYWSGSGNTEAMASMVAKGVEAAGKSAKVVSIDDFQASELKDEAVFALGCPAMGDEVLEETIVEPFVAEVEKFASGKIIGLFGSYGWGDGQWMRDWASRLESSGAKIAGGEGVICNEAPDDDAVAACKKLGEQLAAE